MPGRNLGEGEWSIWPPVRYGPDYLDQSVDSWLTPPWLGLSESEIEDLIAKIDDAGGMYRAVESGLVQGIIGESALAFESRIESGEQKVVGVNCYVADRDDTEPPPFRPDPQAIERLVAEFNEYKEQRSKRDSRKALDMLARTANSENENIFGAVVESARLGATHGEIVACLRNVLGFGHPLIVP